MIISEITINEAREIDSIKLKINDSLVDYISKEEVVSIKDAPSSFMLRNVGVSKLNLDIAIQRIIAMKILRLVQINSIILSCRNIYIYQVNQNDSVKFRMKKQHRANLA